MLLTITRGVAAAALVVGVAGCASGTTGTAAPTSATVAAATTSASAGAGATTAADPSTDAASTPAPTSDDRAAVEKTFHDYNAALLARDFTTACGLTSPDAVKMLIDALAAQGAQVGSCEEAFKAVYSVPAASGPLDDAARTSKISNVSVDGDVATVTYSGEASGVRKEGLTNKMQRIGGQWKLLGNDA